MQRGDIFKLTEPVFDDGYVITRNEQLFPLYGVCIDSFGDGSLTTLMYVPDSVDPANDGYTRYHWDWMPEHQEKMEVIDA